MPFADDTHEAPAVRQVLSRGTVTVTGRLTDASNLTLQAVAEADGLSVTCVYKPIRGERPLWDFPDGTLAHREVAAYRISEFAGWNCVPLTVLRDGPYGKGMVQQWIDTPAGPGEVPDLVDLVPAGAVPEGYRAVFHALDPHGDEVAVVHADDPALAVLAGFDQVVNNADRKGSHVLSPAEGVVVGVDHGLTFHTEDKLRTILWGWAGDPLPDTVVDGLRKLSAGLCGDLRTELRSYLTPGEVEVLELRVSRMLGRPVFRQPPRGRSPIPWPPL